VGSRNKNKRRGQFRPWSLSGENITTPSKGLHFGSEEVNQDVDEIGDRSLAQLGSNSRRAAGSG